MRKIKEIEDVKHFLMINCIPKVLRAEQITPAKKMLNSNRNEYGLNAHKNAARPPDNMFDNISSYD